MGLALKIGVTVTVTPQIDRILRVAQVAYATIMGNAFQVVVTSGHDGNHMNGSLHYQDRALDFRTGHSWDTPLMTDADAQAVRDELKGLLGMGFDVVLEKDHIHVEYDPV